VSPVVAVCFLFFCLRPRKLGNCEDIRQGVH
jgi:hypothetical protein